MRPESTPELIERARRFVLEKPSVSYMQRKLGIGYNHAMELMEHFEESGIVSKPNSAGVRTILDRSAALVSTDKEINRATINAFIARCINRGAASAIDAEFGLRVVGAEVRADAIRIEFQGGHVLYIGVDEIARAILEPPTLESA